MLTYSKSTAVNSNRSLFSVALLFFRRSTVGALVLGARVLEVPAQRKVPVRGADWRGRPPSLLNGKRSGKTKEFRTPALY